MGWARKRVATIQTLKKPWERESHRENHGSRRLHPIDKKVRMAPLSSGGADAAASAGLRIAQPTHVKSEQRQDRVLLDRR